MSAATEAGPVSAYVRMHLGKLLDERRVVVWYDPARDFADLVGRLDPPGCVLVSAADSRLRARREAEAVYRQLNDSGGSPNAHRNLLIYLPTARGATPEEQQQDPFESFARCGATFGDQDGERLEGLARRALPAQDEEIARLFREGRPTLALLDDLPAGGARYPLVRQALDAESPVEAIVVALTRHDTAARLDCVPGALSDLRRLIEAELGMAPPQAGTWPELCGRLAAYLAMSELAADLGDALPSPLAGVPHAETSHLQHARAVLDRLRATDAGHEAYVQLAGTVEHELRLPAQLGELASVGTHETFACQERAHLRALVRTAAVGDLAAAHKHLASGEGSVWRRDPERQLLWQVTQRCVDFLDLAHETESRKLPTDVRALVEAYTVEEGGWRLDHAQRLYEHSSAQCAQDDEIEPLVRACRARYHEVAARPQATFQSAVAREGWPPEGMRRQTQTFDTLVAPELEQARKVAYFLVDSLRYEMGRDLAAALAELGSARVEAAVSVLPTITPCGMAALLPGADGAFTVVEQRGELVPAIGDTPLPDAAERKALLAARYGDRHFDITLEELLSTAPRMLAKRIGQADLVVVRTQDIDAAGEGHSLYRARKVMSEVISELKTAAIRLASIGFETLVFAADHGHVLVPEVPAGDVLSVPAGEWLLRTRRSLLGRAQANPPGLLYLSTQQVGIVAPVAEYVAAGSFKTFRGDAGYFHEGLSLQECIIPVVTVRLTARQEDQAGGNEQVAITYRNDYFASAVIGLKLRLMSMFTPSLTIRLEAFESANPKAQSVGQAGDCQVRDPATGEITLQRDIETQVPLVIDPDFSGKSIEVRAFNPRTNVVLGRLRLKNARME